MITGVRTTFSKDLGFGLLGDAMWNTPYRTGNLVSTISLPINTPEFIRVSIGGAGAVYAGSVDERGRSKNYTTDITDKMLETIAHYFITGSTPKGVNFSWSQSFYNITQEKGVGTLGERGTRHLVGRSGGETREQRRKRSISSASYYMRRKLKRR